MIITINFRASNTNLSIKEKGRLVFKMLGVPRGKCIIFNESRREKAVLTISGSVPVSTLNLTQSFQAKPGLWTKPVAPIVKEKMVYLHWTLSETDNRELRSILECFGVVSGPIKHQRYQAKRGAEEEERMMDGVMTMDRQVKMKIRRNIPSIILVEGRKVNVRYDIQPKSCSRCLQRLHICPTRGDARNSGTRRTILKMEVGPSREATSRR